MLSRKFIALAILAVAACSESPTTNPSDDPAIGQYVLKIVSGKTLPYTQSPGVVITDGTIFLSADGTYTSAVHRTVTQQNGTTVVETVGLPEGGWSRLSDSNIKLVPVRGDQLAVEAQLSGVSLNFSYTDAAWGYVRQ